MTNLNINAVVGTSNHSHVIIEVVGGIQTGMRRQGTYTLTVPRDRLSQTFQKIHRFGGRITNITTVADFDVQSTHIYREETHPNILGTSIGAIADLDNLDQLEEVTAIPTIVSESSLETNSEPITEHLEPETFLETIPEQILETVVETISEQPAHTVTESITEVVTPSAIKVTTEVESPPVAKAKKLPETSTKTSSPKPSSKTSHTPTKAKAASIHNSEVDVAIAEPILETISAPVIEVITTPVTNSQLETAVEVKSDVTSEPVIEIIPEPIAELTDELKPDELKSDFEQKPTSVALAPKAKRNKTSAKSSSGFNKPKHEQSVENIPEAIAEVLSTPVAESEVPVAKAKKAQSESPKASTSKASDKSRASSKSKVEAVHNSEIIPEVIPEIDVPTIFDPVPEVIPEQSIETAPVSVVIPQVEAVSEVKNDVIAAVPVPVLETSVETATVISDPIVETKSVESIVEPVAETISEPIAQTESEQKVAASLKSKEKKTKTSAKSGSGFNKPKVDSPNSKLSRKPKG